MVSVYKPVNLSAKMPYIAVLYLSFTMFDIQLDGKGHLGLS